jgi:hypothetical protein
MKFEQGMSQEEGRGLAEMMATKNARKTQNSLLADVFEKTRSVMLFVSCFFLCLFLATSLLPSTILA